MIFWQFAGFFGAILVLVGYFFSIKIERPNIFNWANVFGSIIMFPANIYFGAFFGAFLTACFGAIGIYGLWKNYRR